MHNSIQLHDRGCEVEAYPCTKNPGVLLINIKAPVDYDSEVLTLQLDSRSLGLVESMLARTKKIAPLLLEPGFLREKK